jgi:hypothetical protein
MKRAARSGKAPQDDVATEEGVGTFHRLMAPGISADFEWLKDSTWAWNKWKVVKFFANGRFFAADGNCEAERGDKRQPEHQGCYWAASQGTVYVRWAGSGVYFLTASADRQGLAGKSSHFLDEAQLQYVEQHHGASPPDPQIVEEAADGGITAEADGDLYTFLGVDDDATQEQVKKAFRKQSLKYHPDKQNKGAGKQAKAETAKLFVQLQEAYAVLGDEDKRILYDTGESVQ